MEGSHEQAHPAAAIGSCACSADSVGLRDAARLGQAQGDACANGNSRLMRRRLFGVGITHQALSTGGIKPSARYEYTPKRRPRSPWSVLGLRLRPSSCVTDYGREAYR